MKGMQILFTGIMVAVVVVLVPFAARPVYAFDADNHIEALIPAESIPAVVEPGAGEGAGMVSEPFVLGNDTRHIEALIPAESIPAVVEPGAGEGAPVAMEHLKLGTDTRHIESLLPAETTLEQQ